MGRNGVFYLQLLLQGMAPGQIHNIGFFLQGTGRTWDEGAGKVTERNVEKTIANHLGCHLFMVI